MRARKKKITETHFLIYFHKQKITFNITKFSSYLYIPNILRPPVGHSPNCGRDDLIT